MPEKKDDDKKPEPKMAACAYCEKENPEDADACAGCGIRFKA